VTAAAGKIIWTEIDEAPALATYSLLPIIRKFTGGSGIAIETADISLSGRILANFPEELTPAQRVPDWLTQLGELAKRPEANIVKLPNISARPRFGSSRDTATRSRTTPRTRPLPRSRRSRRATRRCWAAP